jgi:hypothetical protein
MGFLLTLATLYVPRPIRKQKLQMLFQATADAFQTAVPYTGTLSYEECLRAYAQFTREQADITIERDRESEVRPRLFQNACRIGRQLKAGFRVNATDVMRMGAVVYKILGIDFRADPEGNIVITRCLFSTCYSSRVCELISSLDEGLLAGLAGGGKLTFHQRITEGAECCRAHLEMGGEPG